MSKEEKLKDRRVQGRRDGFELARAAERLSELKRQGASITVFPQPTRVDLFDDFILRLESPRLRLAYAILSGRAPEDYESRKRSGLLREQDKFSEKDLANYRRLFEHLMKTSDEPQILAGAISSVQGAFSAVADWIKKHVLAAMETCGGTFAGGAIQKIKEKLSCSYTSLFDVAKASIDALYESFGLSSFVELILASICAVGYFLAPAGAFGDWVKMLLGLVGAFFAGQSLFNAAMAFFSAVGHGDIFSLLGEIKKRVKKFDSEKEYVIPSYEDLTDVLVAYRVGAIQDKPVRVSDASYSSLKELLEEMRQTEVRDDDDQPDPVGFFGLLPRNYYKKIVRSHSLAFARARSKPARLVFPTEEFVSAETESDEEEVKELRSPNLAGDEAQGAVGSPSDVSQKFATLLSVFGMKMSPLQAMANVVDFGKIVGTARTTVDFVAKILRWFADVLRAAFVRVDECLSAVRMWRYLRGAEPVFSRIMTQVQPFTQDTKALALPANSEVVMRAHSELTVEVTKAIRAGLVTGPAWSALCAAQRALAPLVEIAETVVCRPAVRQRPINVIIEGGPQTGKSSLVAPLLLKMALAKGLGRPISDSEILRPPTADRNFPLAGAAAATALILDDMFNAVREEDWVGILNLGLMLGGAQVTPVASPIAEAKGKMYLNTVANVATENSPAWHIASKVQSNFGAFAARWSGFGLVLIAEHTDEQTGEKKTVIVGTGSTAQVAVRDGESASEIETKLYAHYRLVPLHWVPKGGKFYLDPPSWLVREPNGTLIARDVPTEEQLSTLRTIEEVAAWMGSEIEKSVLALLARKSVLADLVPTDLWAILGKHGYTEAKYKESVPDEDAPMFTPMSDTGEIPPVDIPAYWNHCLHTRDPQDLQRLATRLKANPVVEVAQQDLSRTRKLIDTAYAYFKRAGDEISPYVQKTGFWLPIAIVGSVSVLATAFFMFSGTKNEDEEGEGQSYDIQMREKRIVPYAQPRLFGHGKRLGADKPQVLGKVRSEQISQKLHHVVHVVVSTPGMPDVKSQGFMLSGDCLIMTAHGWSVRALHMAETVVQVSIPTVYQFRGVEVSFPAMLMSDEMKSRFRKELEKTGDDIDDLLLDVALLKLPKPLKGFRNISSMFVPWSVFNTAVGRGVMRIGLSPALGWRRTIEFGVVQQIKTCTVTPTDNAPHQTLTTPYNFVTNMLGESGLCGAIYAFTDDSVPGFFAGIHAGVDSAGRAYFVPLWKELLESLTETTSFFGAGYLDREDTGELPLQTPSEIAQTMLMRKDSDNEEVIPVMGYLQTQAVPQRAVTYPRVHSFRAVPIVSELASAGFLSDRVPSSMQIYHTSQEGVTSHTWYKGLTALKRKVNKMWSSPMSDEFVSWYLSHIDLTLAGSFAGEPYMEDEEVLNGNEFLPPMDRRTSAGAESLPDIRSKSAFITQDLETQKQVFTDLGEETAAAAWENFVFHKFPTTCLTACSKDEPIEERKKFLTRRFFPATFSTQYIEKKAFGRAVTLIKANIGNHYSTVGASPSSLDAAALSVAQFMAAGRQLRGLHLVPCGEDAESNDLSITYGNMEVVKKILLSLNRMIRFLDPEYTENEARYWGAMEDWFLEDQMQQLLLIEGGPADFPYARNYAVLPALMNVSGRWLTTVINDITKHYQFYCAWRLLYPEDIRQHVPFSARIMLLTYSDDGFFVAEHPERWLAALNETDGPKHKVDGVQFIGRNFCFVERVPRFVLRMDSIKQMLTFVSKSGGWLQMWLANALIAAQELQSHPLEARERFSQLMRNVARAFRVDVTGHLAALQPPSPGGF
jgi:hypothetical protein